MWHLLPSPLHAVSALLCLQRDGGTNGTEPSGLGLATAPGPPLPHGAPGATSALTCASPGDTVRDWEAAGLRRRRRGADGVAGAARPWVPSLVMGAWASGRLRSFLQLLYRSLVLPACRAAAVLLALAANVPLLTRCLRRYRRREEPRPPPGGAECAICLGTFEWGQALKILSCSHRYHGRCIDLWHCAQPRGKTCPLCLRRVTAVALVPLRPAPRAREEQGGPQGPWA